MKKIFKKGFTLIELLSVIVVVGILIVVVFPVINNVIENSRQKSYNTTVQNIKTSATMYASEFLDNLKWFVASDNNQEEINEEWTCVQIKKLIEKGYLKDTRKTNNENEPFMINPEDETKITTITNFVELRRDKITHALLRDTITLDSSMCNGGYDTTIPTIDIKLTYEDGNIYNGEWTDRNIVQTITAYDANGISELLIKYGDDDVYHDIETLSKDDTTWIAELIQTKDIKMDTIRIKSIDFFGNYLEKSYAMYLDKTDPTCNIILTGTKVNDTNEWYTSEVKLELQIDDISLVQYDFSKDNIETYNNTTTTLTQIENTIGTTYYAHVKDQVGHTNSCEVTVKKDDITPTSPSLVAYSNTFVKKISSPSGLPPTNAKFGLSGGITSCTCNGSACVNLNSVPNGTINLVCTAYGNNGLSSSATKSIYVRNCNTTYGSCSCGKYVYNECNNSKYCGDCPPPEPVCECSTNYQCQQKNGFGSVCDGCNCTNKGTPSCECSYDWQCQSLYNSNYTCANGCTCTKSSGSEPECYNSSDCGYNEYCSYSGRCKTNSSNDNPVTPTTETTTEETTKTVTKTTKPAGCPAGMIKDSDGGCCTKPGIKPSQCFK